MLLLAPAVGSFLGVIITRTVAGEQFIRGRSRCDHCRHTLSVRELVPLLSFALQRGRCLACGAKIGLFSPAIELAAMLAPASALIAGARGGELVAGCAFGWTLLALGWIDALILRLPDALSLPLLAAGLAQSWWLDPDALADGTLTDRALAAALGYTAFRGLGWAYARLRGREGLGQGDAKLLAAAGAWLGTAALGPVVLLAALSGLAGAALAGLAGRPLAATDKLPFGAFLAAASWAMWLFTRPGIA